MKAVQFHRFARPLRLRLVYAAYQTLHFCALPLILLFLLLRSRREPLYRARLADRFAMGPLPAPGAIWIFSASLGETRAVSPLVRVLLQAGYRVHLTHSTPAALLETEKLFRADIDSARASVGYVPLDLGLVVRLFLRRLRPPLGLVVESEIWPGQLSLTNAKELPMVHINGNLLDRTVERDAKGLRRMRLGFLNAFQKILTKSDAHVLRYQRAGVPAERIRNVGELKFDQIIDPAHLAAADRLRAGHDPSRRTVMISSSIEAEEDILFEMLGGLLDHPARPRLLWVPRSPQRFDAIATRATAMGWKVSRRSEALDADLAGQIAETADLILGDSIGEMNFYYRFADLVFVGASLCNRGGHNIVEPLALGRPVLMGPSLFGITFPAYDAIDAGAMESLPDGPALGARIAELLSDDGALATFAGRADSYGARHLGAAKASLSELRPYLPAPTLSMRNVCAADRDLLLDWRNDPDTRRMSLTQEAISPRDHAAWFDAALRDSDRQILIFETRGEPVGSVRFDRKDNDQAIVSIVLSPEARGLSLSTAILSSAIAACKFDVARLCATIKPDNHASRSIFEKSGFVPASETDETRYELLRS